MEEGGPCAPPDEAAVLGDRHEYLNARRAPARAAGARAEAAGLAKSQRAPNAGPHQCRSVTARLWPFVLWKVFPSMLYTATTPLFVPTPNRSGLMVQMRSTVTVGWDDRGLEGQAEWRERCLHTGDGGARKVGEGLPAPCAGSSGREHVNWPLSTRT